MSCNKGNSCGTSCGRSGGYRECNCCAIQENGTCRRASRSKQRLACGGYNCCHAKIGKMSSTEPAVTPAQVKPDPYTKPVLLRNDKYLARYPVPKNKRDWNTNFPDYAPILFSALELYTIGRDSDKEAKKLADRVQKDNGYEANMCYYPPIWADPEFYGMEPDDRETYFRFNEKALVPFHPLHGPAQKQVEINRVSYLGTYQLHTITGAPLNPAGRTGMVGRGLLGKYGPNHAADPVVTCFADRSQKMLKIALILRKDTKQYALPGGMVDPGENELSSTAIREFCEEALDGNDSSQKYTAEQLKARRNEMVQKFVQHRKQKEPIISTVVDDPRNTDNAWMETQAFWFHFDREEDLGRKLIAGDDAEGARWVTMDDSFNVHDLYADHSRIVLKLFETVRRHYQQVHVPRSVYASG